MKRIKYQFDEGCFSSLTPESLYWLGFLYADGCISQRRNSGPFYTCLSLSIKDEDVLKQFKSFLQTDSPIKYGFTTTQDDKIFKNCRLFINNTSINNSLFELGLIPRKSLIIQFPEFLKNHPLVSHFIRGYFDGDGCVSEKKGITKNSLHLTIVGTYNMMENIQQILLKQLNAKPTKLIRQGNVWSMHVNKKSDIKEIQQFLYKDAKYFLKRKKQIFDNHSELKFGVTSKYKGVCYRPKESVWRASYYENGIRKEKCWLHSEQEAISFLNNLPSNCSISKPI